MQSRCSRSTWRRRPTRAGYFVGDYEGLARSGNSFVAFFAMANNGNLANRTDIFASTLHP